MMDRKLLFSMVMLLKFRWKVFRLKTEGLYLAFLQPSYLNLAFPSACLS
jgi:hypothetical protein